MAPALLLVAASGPVMHLLSLSRQGIAFLWGDYGAVVLHYGLLALSGICAATLVAKRKVVPVMRGLAVIAFLANLVAIGYGARGWRMQAERQLETLSIAPVEAPHGILVAPVSNEGDDLALATDVRNEIDALLRGSGLDASIETRLVAPIPSETQAESMASRLGAQVVVWGVDRGVDASIIEYHVQSLGANDARMTLAPASLLLVAGSQVSFQMREVPALDAASARAREVLPLIAAGHGAMVAGDALQAGGYYAAALDLGGLSDDCKSLTTRLLGVSLLRAGRPDMAAQRYAQDPQLDAPTQVGLGLASYFRGDMTSAATLLARAIEQDPYDAMAYLALAAVSIEQQHSQRAIGAATRAVSLQPDWAPAHAMLGLAYELESNITAAVLAYENCAERAGHLDALANVSAARARAIVDEPPTPVPTLTPWPTPTPTAVPTEGVYRVESGDTLQRIADKLGVNIQVLIELNRLDDPNNLVVGQYLILPEEP
jgi:tetratricopeptide (TPR) repeat protein